ACIDRRTIEDVTDELDAPLDVRAHDAVALADVLLGDIPGDRVDVGEQPARADPQDGMPGSGVELKLFDDVEGPLPDDRMPNAIGVEQRLERDAGASGDPR